MVRGDSPLTFKPLLQLDPKKEYHGVDGNPVGDLAQRVKLHVSLSHDGDYIVANVVAEDT